MKTHYTKFKFGIKLTLALLLAATLPASAQFRGTGGGGGGMGGGGLNRSSGGSSSSGSTRQYYNNSMVGDAMISSDPETRRIIVITDEDTSQFVSQVITNLDRPKPQVLIKVVFLEVTHNDSSDIGVEGGYTHNIDGTTTANGANVFGLGGLSSATSNLSFNAMGQPLTAFTAASPYAGLYQVLGKDFQATVRAIALAGKAKVLSRPSILARNNQPATILVGQTVPLITSVRYDTLGNAINGITYQDVGIMLKVTPFITSDGLVEMIVTPEISSVSQTDKVQIQNGAFAPVIDKRSADTVVVTPDGQTVIIGGLMQNQKTMTETKVPLLGDIPGLGNLFKHKTKTDTKTELMIFLTPHIVQAPKMVAALTAEEKQKSSGTKEFTEEEMNKYFDEMPVKQPATEDGKPARKRKTNPSEKPW
ncbi:MAG: hypothetical protein WCO56_21145 [Verrucomicrobiota bacterium]